MLTHADYARAMGPPTRPPAPAPVRATLEAGPQDGLVMRVPPGVLVLEVVERLSPPPSYVTADEVPELTLTTRTCIYQLQHVSIHPAAAVFRVWHYAGQVG